MQMPVPCLLCEQTPVRCGLRFAVFPAVGTLASALRSKDLRGYLDTNPTPSTRQVDCLLVGARASLFCGRQKHFLYYVHGGALIESMHETTDARKAYGGQGSNLASPPCVDYSVRKILRDMQLAY